MRKIAVMGTGYVGLVSGTCFAEKGNYVICCDVDYGKIERLNQGIIPIYEPGLEELVRQNRQADRLSFTTDISGAIQEAEVIYIAVGTPMSETGEADLRYVEAVSRTIGENLNGYKVIVTKSTVPVGTGRRIMGWIAETRPHSGVPFDVVSNPEFLREGTAVADCLNMERAVIGAASARAAAIVRELHEPFMTQMFETDLESAEMIKYAANAFLATKISFINEIANICEKVGADVEAVATGVGMDNRIGSKFLQAGIGYGGSCFPKDTEALRHIASNHGYEFMIIDSVIKINQLQRQRLLDKLTEVFGSLQGKAFAVLGLSFKPCTDDMRYAPSLDIIPALIGHGANIKAFDPIAVPHARNLLPDCVMYAEDVYDAVRGADAAIILTEWEEITAMDLVRIRGLLKTSVIVDGRNCFELSEMARHGFTYCSVGRPIIRSVAAASAV